MWKFLFIASMAVGALGRTVFSETPRYDPHDPYDEYGYSVASEYCKATNNEDKIVDVKASIKSFITCVIGLYDTDAVERDIQQATNSGVYTRVINKYCATTPQLKECIRGLVKGIAPCLPADQVGPQERSTLAVIDFFCDDNGAKIESFIKNDGPECVRSQRFQLAFCQRDMQTNVTTVTGGQGAAAAIMLPAKERCRILDQSLSCMANTLKGCSNPTPGDLVQELHDLYLSTLSCNEETQITRTEVALGTTAVASQLSGNWHGKEDVERLMKIKLELEVRTAELEMWNRENELKVEHTDLTSDILRSQ